MTVAAAYTHLTPMDRKPVAKLVPPMICVADVDTRLACGTACTACTYHTPDRRLAGRRGEPRPARERRPRARV